MKDIKDYTDEEVKELVEYSQRPDMQDEFKHEAKCYLKKLIDDKIIKDKDGTRLRGVLFELLKEFPMMATYTKYILEEAKVLGFKFKEDDMEMYK